MYNTSGGSGGAAGTSYGSSSSNGGNGASNTGNARAHTEEVGEQGAQTLMVLTETAVAVPMRQQEEGVFATL